MCPKCGKKGYKYSYTTTCDNGNEHTFIEVQHLRWNGHKSVYQSVCYVNYINVCTQKIEIEAKTTFSPGCCRERSGDFSLKSLVSKSNSEEDWAEKALV